MEINTLIIGYVPLTEMADRKAKELRDNSYYKDLISKYDLGNVYYSNQTPTNWKSKIEEINPFIIIFFGSEYYAQEIKDYKPDALMYLANDTGTIFYRKAEIDQKKEKNERIFAEIERFVKKTRDEGEKAIETIRKFSAMTYEDKYKMIQQAIISDDKELSKKAWELLMDNKAHSIFIWMRAQLICECWEASDAKGKEKFLNLAMKDHINNGFAREWASHTDEEGVEYRQYEFLLPNGSSSKYTRRIPVATKEMDKYAYENLLHKYETPNGAQMLIEVNQIKEQLKEHIKIEAEKIYRVLKEWKVNPNKTQRELNILNQYGGFNDKPLKDRDIEIFKKLLKAWDPEKYLELFP